MNPPIESSSSTSNAPLKVKVYGFIPVTRNAYLIIQVVMYVGVVLLLLGLKPILTKHVIGVFIFDHFVPFLVVLALLELGETFFVLKIFKTKHQQLAIPSEEETTSQT